MSKDSTIEGLTAMGQKLDAWINGTPEESVAAADPAPAEAAQ